MGFAEDDAAAMLALDFAVRVTHGAASTTGTLDLEDRTYEADGMTVQKRVSVLRLTTAWCATRPTLAEDSVVYVDAVAYRVRELNLEDDGAVTVLELARR